MKRFIVVMIVLMCAVFVRAGDKEDYQAKVVKLTADQRQMNLTYTVLIREAQAVVKYINEIEAKKIDKKKKKKSKKSKKVKKKVINETKGGSHGKAK